MEKEEEEIILLMRTEKTQGKGLCMMMDKYQKRLYWNIIKLVSDEVVAKDILQETFIKAYQKFYQFKKDSQLYTWLYKIAYNEALQHLRNDKIKKMNNAEIYLKNQASNEMKNADEIQRLLQTGIQQLPEKQRIVFSLRYYDDLPYEEISKILDMSVSSLKTNYHYAKSKIEQYILDNSEEF